MGTISVSPDGSSAAMIVTTKVATIRISDNYSLKIPMCRNGQQPLQGKLAGSGQVLERQD